MKICIKKKKKTIKKIINFFEKNYNFKFSKQDKKIENIDLRNEDFNSFKKIYQILKKKLVFNEKNTHNNFLNKGTSESNGINLLEKYFSFSSIK